MPYTTGVIQAKFKNVIHLENEINYVIEDHSKFINNKPNLKCYPILITKAT